MSDYIRVDQMPAEIERLRAELDVLQDAANLYRENWQVAQGRLAAVLALCDDDFLWPEGHRIQDTVRAAATGETTAAQGETG